MLQVRFTAFLATVLFWPAAAISQTVISGNSGDIGARINAAEAALPANGGKIEVQTLSNGQCYFYQVPIVITKPIIIQGDGPSTCLSYTGSGSAVAFYRNFPSFSPLNTSPDGFGLRDLTLLGTSPTGGQTGISLGGTDISAGFYAAGVTIGNFGIGLMFNRGVWNFKMEHSTFGSNGQSVVWPTNVGAGGENVEFDHVTFVGATFLDSLHFNQEIGGGFSNLNNLTFVACNFDNAQLVIDNGSGGVRLYSPHFENPDGHSGNEPFVRILAYTIATDVIMDGPDFYNDQSNPYPPSFIEIDGGPSVVISQMRSVNLDGTNNVPTNLIIAGDAYVTLLGDAPLRAAQQQYIVTSGNPHLWVMGGQDASNTVQSAGPMYYSQTYEYSDSQSPVVQIGGTDYQPTIGFNLWTGVGSGFYGMQLKETGPNELDFCTDGVSTIGAGNYVCNAGVVNGVFKSIVPDGIAPLTVTSHTPPDNLNAWPATFSSTGAQIENPHITTGKVILPANGQASVAFQQQSQFTQTPSCTISYQTISQLQAPRELSSNPSPGGITIFGQPYIGVFYICVGN